MRRLFGLPLICALSGVFVVVTFVCFMGSRQKPVHRHLETVLQQIIRDAGFDKPFRIEEIGVFDFDKKAYTIEKSTIRLCTDNVEEFDALLFVAIHEVAHALNDSYGHDRGFWDTMRRLIRSARGRGYLLTHDPDAEVCGVRIGSSP